MLKKSKKFYQKSFHPTPLRRSSSSIPTEHWFKGADRRFSVISPPAAAQKYVVDRLRHTQAAAGAKFFEFLVDDFHVRQAPGGPECAHKHFHNALKVQLQCCEHIGPSQEAVRSVYSLPDHILVVLDRPRYIPLAIHNIAQVGVVVGEVDFLALQGHISSQLSAYRHYPALGGIHSHFPIVQPFGNGVQCIL
ncbi:hypothetical protein AYI70_g2369 [Smittium culicis]|uniref:Uncharacterized protein n=1 Tax=Smittium culicis TaxID=133412 RepID=A0A1R1Y8U9_9FUNG|nr:hypothetical protein AYI70_g2369 [Smittium culicis]